MNGQVAQSATAKTIPPIPVREQGTRQGSNSPAPASANPPAPSAPGAAVYTGTPQQIRDQITSEIRAALRNGGNPQIVVPNDFLRNVVPTGAVNISIAMFVTIGFIIVMLPVARAFARRMDSRSRQVAGGGAELRPAIEQLQQSVDAMAIEVERITEAQRFQSRLMAERAKEPARLA